MTQLRQKMLEELQRLDYSYRTANTYIRDYPQVPGPGGIYSVNRPIVTSPKRGAKRLKRQVDWLVNGLLTGLIFSRALNQLTQLEIFPAREKDGPFKSVKCN